ncbi:helix-turn-helix domain-containing protein [Citrobacter koseri]|uniref:helix-turn-helix domain-containing protein n=1 Tax=Citrobacter koseri TaxID=545 RepID=UPI003EDF13A9
MTTAASNTGFLMLANDLLNVEKVSGKPFTGNMKIVYSLIQGYERNGQTAYFSQLLVSKYLSMSLRNVSRLIKEMVEMGLINKTEQVNGGTLNYTVNPITAEMLGQVTAAPAAPTKPAVTPTVETVADAGINQPGIIECGSESVHESNTAAPGVAPVDCGGLDVRPAPVPVPVKQEAANDDLRNPVINFVADSNVMIINGEPVTYLEPEESDIDDFGDAF